MSYLCMKQHSMTYMYRIHYNLGPTLNKTQQSLKCVFSLHIKMQLKLNENIGFCCNLRLCKHNRMVSGGRKTTGLYDEKKS